MRVLDHLVVDVHGVAHHHRGDPLDVAPLVEDLDLGALGLALAGALVDPPRARSQRKVRVVDHVDEVRRIDRRGVVAAVAGIDHGGALGWRRRTGHLGDGTSPTERDRGRRDRRQDAMSCHLVSSVRRLRCRASRGRPDSPLNTARPRHLDERRPAKPTLRPVRLAREDRSMTSTEPSSDRVRLRRMAQRGAYDRAAVFDVLDAGLIAHVGVATAEGPIVLPMAYGRTDEWLYVHGSVANAALRARSTPTSA